MMCYTFLDGDGNVLGYWHTDDERKMHNQCMAYGEEIGAKVYYTEGYIDEEVDIIEKNIQNAKNN